MNYCVNCGRPRNDSQIAKGFLPTQLMPFERFLCCECNIAQLSQTKALFDCTLSDKVVPKPRPKVTKNATFFPATYTRWRTAASKEITEAIRLKLKAENRGSSDLLPLDKKGSIAIFVDFFGSLRGNSDLDNAIGSIMDVMAFEGWCLTNDNVQRIPLIYARFHPLPKSTKKNPQVIRTEVRFYSLPDEPALESSNNPTVKALRTPEKNLLVTA